MITITEAAKAKISEVLEDEPGNKLRMYIKGGGCSGMSYCFAVDSEHNEDDFEFPAGSSSVLIDSLSMQYLHGAVVDYKEDLQGARFSISNPKAITTCGCGSSFSPY